MIEAYVFLLIGLAFLIVGSNILVTSTEKFSVRYNISGFLASFFMIGIATSAPEIFISIESALVHKTELAVGNAIGSNISNIAIVFCISIFFIKLSSVELSLPKRPFYGMLILTLITLIIISIDNVFNVYDSLILIFLFFGVVFYLKEGDSNSNDQIIYDSKEVKLFTIFPLSILALVLLVYGSNLFITGASDIATYFGISSYVIGLTLTAIGTSLPELAASIQSAKKGRADFIIGNILGSNIFNIALAMSIAGMINSAVINEFEFLRDMAMLLLCMGIFYAIVKVNKIFIKTLYSSLLVITYFLYLVFILG